MRIGCLFGSFDPPHMAHTAIARHMHRHLGLHQVWLVVTPANPFKTGVRMSAEHHRVAMVRLALLKEEGLLASGVELDLPRPNFTVDTLRFMRQRWPDDVFSLIIGSDNLAGFHKWKEPGDILAHHELLVYPRPGIAGHLAASQYGDHPAVRVVHDAPMIDISSTEIRRAIKEWRPVEGLVAPAVLSYIHQHKLYL